jgi:hypothetical protein
MREGTWSFAKRPCVFYLHWVAMAFIEWWLFRDEKRSSTVYERLSIDFIFTGSRWHLLNGCSSTIREATWPFTNGSCRFYLHGVVMAFIECEVFHEKRRNLTVYERLMIDFNYTESGWYLWKKLVQNKRRNLTLDTWRKTVFLFVEWNGNGIYWRRDCPWLEKGI